MVLQFDNLEFWREFIRIYRDSPALWKVKSEEFKKRNLKEVGYTKLVQKMKEINADADKTLVRSKILSLRTSYRRELKKIYDSIKSGEGTEDIYIPTVWCFIELDFLREQETQIHGTSLKNLPNEDDEGMNETVVEEGFSHPPSQQQPTLKLNGAWKRKSSLEREEVKRNCLMDLTLEPLQSSFSDSKTIAKGWGLEFSKMKADQQLFAKKFIDDIIFEGRLGNLHRHSVTVNQPTNSLFQ